MQQVRQIWCCLYRVIVIDIFVDTRISHSSNESNTDHGVIKWQTKFCRKQYNLHITISTVILFKQWTKKCHSNWALHEKKTHNLFVVVYFVWFGVTEFFLLFQLISILQCNEVFFQGKNSEKIIIIFLQWFNHLKNL